MKLPETVSTRLRTVATLFALAVTVVLALGLVSTAAGAHEGEGQLDLVSATRVDGNAVDLVVMLTFVGDGHGVPDATVTAVVGEAAAVPLTSGVEEGQYQGTVVAPAGSTIRVTSVEPVVTLELPAPDPSASTTSAVPSPPPTEAPTTAEASPTTTSGATPTDGRLAEGPGRVDDQDDGLSTGILVAVGAGVVAVAAAGIWVALNLGRGRDDGSLDDPGPLDPS